MQKISLCIKRLFFGVILIACFGCPVVYGFESSSITILLADAQKIANEILFF